MNFFKKIFRFLSSTNASKKQVSSNVDRAPRITLTTLAESDPEVVMECASLNETPLVRVVNLSTSGLALASSKVLRELKVNSLISGRIRLPQKDGSVQAIDVVCEIRRMDDEVVGCSVREGILELRKGLEEHYASAFAGVQMTKVNSDILALEPDGQPHLYRGPRGSELFFVADTRQHITRFELGFLGHFVSMNGRAIMMGTVINEHSVFAEDHKPKPKAANIVRGFGPIDDETKALAIAFVRAAHGLEPKYADQMVSILNS